MQIPLPRQTAQNCSKRIRLLFIRHRLSSGTAGGGSDCGRSLWARQRKAGIPAGKQAATQSERLWELMMTDDDKADADRGS